MEQLSAENGKTSGEVDEQINRLLSQIHDASIRVGPNLGFVGTTHDSPWSGMTHLQEQLDQQEGKLDQGVPTLPKKRWKKWCLS